jgi:hypothetical protein
LHGFEPLYMGGLAKSTTTGKTSVDGLKQDVDGLKQDVDGLKQDVKEVLKLTKQDGVKNDAA